MLGTWFADTLQEVHINILWVFEDYQKITLLIQVAESERRLNYPLDKKNKEQKVIHRKFDFGTLRATGCIKSRNKTLIRY